MLSSASLVRHSCRRLLDAEGHDARYVVLLRVLLAEYGPATGHIHDGDDQNNADVAKVLWVENRPHLRLSLQRLCSSDQVLTLQWQ